MLAPLAPLIAYRLDRARPGVPTAAALPSLATPMSAAPAGLDALVTDLAVTPDEEANWLRVALALDRAARARGEDRDTMLRQFLDDSDMHPLPAAPLPYPFVSATARKHAESMEDWAFLRLANTTLAAAGAVLPDALLLERGRVLDLRARVARKLGATSAARLYYEEVESLGTAGSLPELAARSFLGRGVLAHYAGNAPSAREHYQRAIALDGAAPDTVAWAHHGLMVASAEKGEYDASLKHGWEAYAGASNKRQQDAMLVDLAQGLLDTRQYHAALRGFACALSRHPHPRSALPAFGGTALAAVAARGPNGARSIVRLAALRVESLVASLGGGPSPMLPYDCASALMELSEALRLVGEKAWSARCGAQAAQIASLHQFHRISYRLENAPAVPDSTPETSPVQREIALRVEALEGAELVGV